MSSKLSRRTAILHAALLSCTVPTASLSAHGTVTEPASRVYRVYRSNPQNPSFALARNAVRIDGTQSYYTWNELSRNIPEAVRQGLPPGFDYSPWVPDGQLASGGRVDKQSSQYPRTYAGLDQVSPDWPKTSVTAGQRLRIRFLATAPHNPSAWDVWMTKPTWDARTPLRWAEMEFLERPRVAQSGRYYEFDLVVPRDRSGHHVLWIAWQRNDAAGEVFFSTSDLDVQGGARFEIYGSGCAGSDNRIPSLTNGNPPLLGQQFALDADRAAPGSTLHLMLGGRTRQDLGPLAQGCTLWATPAAPSPPVPWPGRRTRFMVPIPNDPRLLGQKFSAQLVILDPGVRSRILKIALSNGGEATIG